MATRGPSARTAVPTSAPRAKHASATQPILSFRAPVCLCKMASRGSNGSLVLSSERDDVLARAELAPVPASTAPRVGLQPGCDRARKTDKRAVSLGLRCRRLWRPLEQPSVALCCPLERVRVQLPAIQDFACSNSPSRNTRTSPGIIHAKSFVARAIQSMSVAIAERIHASR